MNFCVMIAGGNKKAGDRGAADLVKRLGPTQLFEGYHKRWGIDTRYQLGNRYMVYVRTKKGWMTAIFTCKKLKGIERDILEACFEITGGSNRLFGGGFASALKIAKFLEMDQTEESYLKINKVLKFLKLWTWISLNKKHEDGLAYRITVSKSCFRLVPSEVQAVEKSSLYINHIRGSGVDSKPKDSKPFENIVPPNWTPPAWMLRKSKLAAGFVG